MSIENVSSVVLSAIRRDVRNSHFEMTDTGLFLPKQQVGLAGFYTHQVNGIDERSDTNRIPIEGINHMLDVVFHGVSPVPTWYMALYGANYSPTDSITAANFAATTSEITSTTEGYTQSTRPEFVEDAAVAGSLSNSTNKAAFTIATATELSVYGVALLSSNVRGGTSGVLISISKFTQPRRLVAGDVLSLAYTVGITSA